MSNIGDISIFLDRYKDFSKRLERQKIIHYKTRFDGLFGGYDSLKNAIGTFNSKEAQDFNIFDILNINTLEVKTHTPFLKNILDTSGTHGQSDLFLKSFINNFIPIDKRDNFNLNNKNDYHIEEEKPFQNGRIDIYLQSIDPKQKFGVVIENKLYAGDQHLQIKRYYDFIKSRKFEDSQMMIYYLTIDGNDPSTHSIDKKMLTELKDRNILRNLSYKIDILDWLSSILPFVKSDKVKFLLEQYIMTIHII